MQLILLLRPLGSLSRDSLPHPPSIVIGKVHLGFYGQYQLCSSKMISGHFPSAMVSCGCQQVQGPLVEVKDQNCDRKES